MMRQPPTRQDHVSISTLGFFLAMVISGAFGVLNTDAATAGTSYTEDLTVERLGQHHVGARFVFRSRWTPQARHRCQDHEDWHEGGEAEFRGSDGKAGTEQAGKLCHFEAVFPRAVGVLLDRFKVRDLSLQMSKGRWDTTAWGNGPGDGSSGEYTPGGAEMWARLPADGAWDSWVGLRRSLSGLYCSSLDGLDETRVHTPSRMAMPGESTQGLNDTTVLRGTLPREPVCTENLIPLIKMLPCRSKTGLGRLLHPTRLFQSDYHSISVRASATFSDRADNNSNTGPPENAAGADAADAGGGNGLGNGVITSLTLEQTVLAVFRARPHLPSAVSPRSARGAGSSGSSASGLTGKDGDDTEAKIIPEGEGWSISSLLLPLKAASSGAFQLEGCPVATRSAIRVAGGRTPGRGDALSSAAAGCAVPGSKCDAGAGGAADASGDLETPVKMATRVLLPGTAEEKENLDDLSSPGSSSIADFLLEKLWDFAPGEVESPGGLPAESSRISGDGTAKGSSSSSAAAAASSAAPAVARLDHYLSGRGGTRGVSVANLVNMHPTSGAFADFLQPVPYFMVPLLGTLRARLVPSCSSASSRRLDDGAATIHSFSTTTTTTTTTEAEETPPARIVHGGTPLGGGQRCNGDEDGGLGRSRESAAAAVGPLVSLARNVTLTPGEGLRPAVVEVRVWVPAASTVVLGFDFFKRFLTVEDFPPDPSRGFDVPPPLARFSFAEREMETEVVRCREQESEGEALGQGESCAAAAAAAAAAGGGDGLLGEAGGGRRGGRVVYAYGEAGLLDIPQPDFSMPFNVITFTSTVITFFLGTAINLLVRKSASARRKKKTNEKEEDERKGASREDGDRNGLAVDRAGGGDDKSRRWYRRSHGLLRGALGFWKPRRGESTTGRRIRKEIGRLKDE